MTQPSSYVCDTLPAPRLAADHPLAIPVQVPNDPVDITSSSLLSSPSFSQPVLDSNPRKLCVRHQRMADEGTNLKLQQSLDALPVEEREAVNAIWSNFSSSSHRRRAIILQGLLTMCCFSQLSLLTEQLAHLIRIDPFAIFPREISIKILGSLDATSLCRAAQVSRKWRSLADDDVLWRGICEQHIGQKCRKCGWGLPVLENKRNFCPQSSPPPPPALHLASAKRRREDAVDLLTPKLKRQRLDSHLLLHSLSFPSELTRPLDTDASTTLLASNTSRTRLESLTRPWKDVYSERMTIERNWRRGRCTVRTLEGHTDGIMCLQFNETLSHPAFPVLITGSYDRTVRVWNLETGVELHCLKGHERAVRALQFDEAKLITGSMDRTLKVWDWRSGKCIRTLTGHSEGVVSLNFDSNVLASGSVDSTIKVWNLRTGGAFTLRGHSDWVNAVQLWDSNGPTQPSSTDLSLLDVSGVVMPNCSSGAEIDAGKMLFSASDDGTIRMWDLTSRICVRTIAGHVAQVQSMKLLLANDCSDESPDASPQTASSNSSLSAYRKKPLLISGSLDNTIKLWDIETGKSVQTFFGHIEGVWAVASDELRLVSGSHDRTIKVWSREEGRCTATLVGHQAAVSCLALGEDKIISGSDDASIKVWSFSE